MTKEQLSDEEAIAYAAEASAQALEAAAELSLFESIEHDAVTIESIPAEKLLDPAAFELCMVTPLPEGGNLILALGEGVGRLVVGDPPAPKALPLSPAAEAVAARLDPASTAAGDPSVEPGENTAGDEDPASGTPGDGPGEAKAGEAASETEGIGEPDAAEQHQSDDESESPGGSERAVQPSVPDQAAGEPEPAQIASDDAPVKLPLTELQERQVTDATGKLLAKAAAAVRSVLGEERPGLQPQLRRPGEAHLWIGRAGGLRVTSSELRIDGERCLLVGLWPERLIRRIGDAFERFSEGPPDLVFGEKRQGPAPLTVTLPDALSEAPLRVWVELGRTRLPLGKAMGLPLGAVVDLDRAADAPIELFVNGVAFAHGQLLVTEDGEWAFKLEGLNPAPESQPLRTPSNSPEDN